ncbi:methylmalonyl-CoA mutase [Nakamurella flava]|uniref:Methylmalonyl-CoA mutase n=1 Tax=Nakamurella flava TaxID=2576308 RepID=A0A4U6QMM6_9ACTN|nr:methylmalonyl-CoA mutase family protein [Nakamurella flava]TKV61418.1 methylmalonyl-CoA mutase [Nakamurella flava]
MAIDTARLGADGTARLDADGAALVAEESAWRELAAGVLRRNHPDATPATVRRSLTRTTVEGLPVPVLGTPATCEPVGSSPIPVTERVGWDVRSLILVTDGTGSTDAPADQARRESAGGSTSLWLRLPPDESLDVLAGCLAGMPLDGRCLAVDADDSIAAARVLVEAVGSGVRLHPDTVVGVDPFAAAVRSGGAVPAAGECAAAVRALTEAADTLGVGSIAADGTAAHDAGAGEAGELGWMLAVGVALLREMTSGSTDVAAAARRIEFRLAATVQLYPTVAKFRAARVLWDRVLQLCGVSGVPARLHAVTSRPMLTRRDPETNLLRTTVAAFAAGAGGADAVTVLPYDHAARVSGAAARRWARNISHLLIAESHVGQAVDPAAGAFAVEELTQTLAEAAWAEFGRIEAAGGARAALAEGAVGRRWAAAADERDRRIADGRQPLIGVTVHPPATAEPPGPPPVSGWPPPRTWEPADVPSGKDAS